MREVMIEVAVIAAIGYVVYCVLRSSVLQKSRVATELQKAFAAVARTSFYTFEGDTHIAARQYVETYWDMWKPLRKQAKIRPPFMALLILREAATNLHNVDHPNTDFVLDALRLASMSHLQNFKPSNEIEEQSVGFAIKSFGDIFRIRNGTIPKGLEELTG